MSNQSSRRLILSTFLLLTLLGLAIPQRRASACSCGRERPEINYEYSGAVFAGTVIENPFTFGSLLMEGSRLYKFLVRQYWKGDVGLTIFVESGNMCGPGFSLQQDYLVYAQVDRDNRVSARSPCDALPLGQASQDLAFLGSGSLPGPDQVGTVGSGADPLDGLFLTAGIVLLLVIVIALEVRRRKTRSGISQTGGQ